MPEAKPIHEHPFTGDTLFVLGNEGAGLNQNQKDICDQFVYISQYTDKTASLNVAIASSIIFHHFALWAGYEEAGREGEKFSVESQKYRTIEAQQNRTTIMAGDEPEHAEKTEEVE